MQKELFKDAGLDFKELDFGKEKELRSYIDDYAPGVVVLLGGNTFLLRRALKQSGFDDILREDVRENKYVLAGHSAGSIVVGPSLEGFERMDKENLVMPKYQKEIVWDGLGLTETRIIPHADSPKYDKSVVELRKELFDKKGWDSIILNDSAVYVVDGDKKEILE